MTFAVGVRTERVALGEREGQSIGTRWSSFEPLEGYSTAGSLPYTEMIDPEM